MKIAITGHTKGLGLEFKKVFEAGGHEVIGFSRSTGYDLRDWSKMQKMLDQVDSCNIFINVAKPDFVQTTVLYELWKRWKKQDKTIINIGSGITYTPVLPQDLFNDPDMDFYRTAKVSLNQAAEQLAFKSYWPRIVTVNPVHLYSDPITAEEQVKLSAWVATFVAILSATNNSGFQLRQLTF
jgi:NAD(P)-dependent dehydrogenase (short-subunit alcohol dehydrogenase family)